MAIVSMKQLLEAGVHFGHRSRRWNPKMRPYIFTERNGIHIIDLQQTIRNLESAYAFVRDTVAEGGSVIFVGTKRQAQENVRVQAERCGMPYVTERWLGGTLTNFRTIRSRVDYMLELEEQVERGELERLPKKESTLKQRELAKLHRRLGGLRNLNRLPEALFVTDVNTEDIAVKEATRLQIPIIAIADTNVNPDPIDFVIPANDDAIRALLLLSTKIADAVIEGQQMRGVIMEEEGEVSEYDQVPEAYVATPEDEEEEPEVIEVQAPEAEIEGDDDLIIVDDEEGDEYA